MVEAPQRWPWPQLAAGFVGLQKVTLPLLQELLQVRLRYVVRPPSVTRSPQQMSALPAPAQSSALSHWMSTLGAAHSTLPALHSKR
jgi:hypothetical protein